MDIRIKDAGRFFKEGFKALVGKGFTYPNPSGTKVPKGAKLTPNMFSTLDYFIAEEKDIIKQQAMAEFAKGFKAYFKEAANQASQTSGDVYWPDGAEIEDILPNMGYGDIFRFRDIINGHEPVGPLNPSPTSVQFKKAEKAKKTVLGTPKEDLPDMSDARPEGYRESHAGEFVDNDKEKNDQVDNIQSSRAYQLLPKSAQIEVAAAMEEGGKTLTEVIKERNSIEELPESGPMTKEKLIETSEGKKDE